MNFLKKLYRLLYKNNTFIKNIGFLIILTRLIFLENNQILMCFEILSGIIVLAIKQQYYGNDTEL